MLPGPPLLAFLLLLLSQLAMKPALFHQPPAQASLPLQLQRPQARWEGRRETPPASPLLMWPLRVYMQSAWRLQQARLPLAWRLLLGPVIPQPPLA